MPKLSIIVPVYNAQAHIARCIDAVLSQTFRDFEAIFVDDGSTDKSAELLAQAAARDGRVKVLSQPNGGIYAARNAALARAQGEWVGFVDADDVPEPDFYEKLLAAGHADVDIVMGGTRCFSVRKAGRRRSHAAGVLRDTAHKISALFNGAVWDKLFRAAFLRERGLVFEKGLFAEDNLFSIKSVCYARAMACVPDAFYGYFQNPDSICHADGEALHARRVEDTFQIAEKIVEFAKAQRFDARAMRAVRAFAADTVLERRTFRIARHRKRLQALFGAWFVFRKRFSGLCRVAFRTLPAMGGYRRDKVFGLTLGRYRETLPHTPSL